MVSARVIIPVASVLAIGCLSLGIGVSLAEDSPSATPAPTAVATATPAVATATPAPTATGSASDIDPTLNGLVREKKHKLYYYRAGVRVTNTLIRIKRKRIYYFGPDGKAIRNSWLRHKGYTYYFKKNARAARGSKKIRGRFRIFNKYGHLVNTKKLKTVRVDGVRYLVRKNGYAAKSNWYPMDGRMLHTRKNGTYDLRKRVGYIPMNRHGFAKNPEQVQAMLLARKFIRRHTNRSDSAMTKFYKCFKTIIGGTFYVGDWRPSGFGKPGWQYRSAIEMLGGGLVGDCYGISCAVAACAKELGFQPYVIWAAHSHAFVIVDGKYYDNMHGAKFGTTTHEPYVTKEKFKF